MDWSAVFAVKMPVVELVVRASVMYLFLFVLFRFGLRRDIGALGLADVLVLVIIADASQNAMAGPYTTVTEGVIVVCTIAAWNTLIDRLAYRFDWFSRFASPEVLTLVKHGRVVAPSLRKEHLTEEELMSKLRAQGVEHLREVKFAFMESDGDISVIKYDARAKRDTGKPTSTADRVK